MGFFQPQNPGIGGLDELTSSEEIFIHAFAALSYADGDILYYDNGQLNRLPIGNEDDSLYVASSGLPAWTNKYVIGVGTRTITVASSAPGSPAVGDLWVDIT